MAYDYTDMSIDDLSSLVANKRQAQNIYTGAQKWDTPEQLKLGESNNALRSKYGITGDDMNLEAASALLAKKQEAANPLNGYSSGKAQFSETPLDSYTVKGTDALYNDLWGTDGNDVISKVRAENEKAGENAYNSAIGNMTEFTGGRLNSWAAKAAADSKQAYADKGDAAVAELVQNLLNTKQNFVNSNASNSTGIWDRAMYEKQQPITNAQEDKRIAIDDKLADADIVAGKKKASSSSSSSSATATNRSQDSYYNGLIAENGNTDGESLYANLANNQQAYIQNMGSENYSKAVKYARDKYYQTVLNRWRGNEPALAEELQKKPGYYQNVLGIENYNKLLNNAGSGSGF